jgi:integrase
MLSNIKVVAVEEWLGGLPLANGSKAKIRNVMSALFTHAMRYEWLDRNPMALVRQSAKRERAPEVLDVKEIQVLLENLGEPYQTMVFLACSTGLRVSELMALKWSDVDFDSLEIRLRRAISAG